MTSSGDLFYPPAPAQFDGTIAGRSSIAQHSRYQYSAHLDTTNDMHPTSPYHLHSSHDTSTGVLNEGAGLSYMTAPLVAHNQVDDNETEKVAKTPSKHPRLLSLDCFRGLVIAWMIMADEAGPAWTNILDHSPWDGIRFADFVFPAFVFIVGMSVPLATRKFASDRIGVTRKAVWRAIKMFTVGWITASGGFPKPTIQQDPSTWQLSTIRIPGILQRIAFCYLVTVLMQVWIPAREEAHTPNSIAFGRSRFALFKKYAWHWLAAALIMLTWLLLTFATHVPGCGYGNLDPECNATRYWDAKIIGYSHMYRNPTLQRSAACSSNPPGDDPIPNRPYWCDLPFDPEGIVGTFTACLTGFFGLFFGWVLANEKSHTNRLKYWMGVATVSMAAGLILHFSGAIPMNKNLWSLSYVFVMVGVDGTVFSIFYFIVDMRQISMPLWPLICMGMNAILVFVVAQSDASVDTVLQWFYLNKPDENLYYWYRVDFLQAYTGVDWAIFLWGLTKVTAWLIISVILHKMQIFWKL